MSDAQQPTGGQSKAHPMMVRLDRRERYWFTRAAQVSGLSLSSWVRQALHEAAERRLGAVDERPEWTA